ncbi:unnamed protein product [Coregonus sp. 'balchen']|nr:unnamed protein product [Coregonus sp. 'balchen']
MSKNKVLNLKDKIDGNEMDLSLCNLTEVPVKELLEFCSLSHLVKVDLSKNQMTVLPDDLGRLGNLQHLDLYNNKLTILPNLKWLDLKDNPLEINLAKAAGDCLDEKQCKQCAARVLQHMRILQDEVDKERERRFLKDKELEKKKETKQREREAKEREARKRDKAEEKERKRKEYNAHMAALAVQEQKNKRKEEKKKRNGQIAADKKAAAESTPKARRRSLIGLLFKLLLLLLLGLAGVVGVCQLTGLKEEAVCAPINVAVDDGLSWVREQEVDVRVRDLVQEVDIRARELLQKLLEPLGVVPMATEPVETVEN